MTLLDAIEGAHQKLLRPSGGCHNCPRRRVDYVPPTLHPTKLIFVGEGPGAKEVEQGEGFVGRAGELLRTTATEYRLPPFSVTNVIHCRPPSNAPPKPKEIACCLSQFVLNEIVDYPIVVLCGTVALQSLFPKAKATHFRGNIAYHPDFPDQRFYTMYHPAAVLHNPYLKPQFKQQMERLARIVAGEPEPEWRVLQGGTPEMFAALDTMLASPLISLDFETTSLKSWEPTSRIRSLSLTADGKTAVFVHEEEPHWIGVADKIHAYLERSEKAVVGSHIGFDLDFAEHEWEFVVQCTGIHDVMVLYYELKQYKEPSLKELTSRELDGYRYLILDPSKEYDITLLSRYNAEDAIHAYHLFRKAIQELKPKTRDLVVRVLGPVCLPIQQMHSTGLYLRQDYRRAKIEEYKERRCVEIEQWHAKDPTFIPTKHESGKGLHHYLFEIHKLPILERTKTNEPQVDKYAIKQWIRSGALFLQHLLQIREIDKIQSTYLTAYDKHIDDYGRIHPSHINTYTDSGRNSSRDPNTYNIPRLEEIRDQFGVPPGSRMMEADLSQIEFRIMVCRAKDETGIAAYARGDDAHTATARTMIGGGREPTKEERSRAKPVNFGLIYGGSWENVQNSARLDYDIDLPEDDCRKFTSDFFTTYKRLPEFHRACRQRLTDNRGWFESVLGHTFHYRDWDNADTKRRDHAFRAALNSEAQGPAAQICFAIMVHTRRLLNKYNMAHVRFVNSVYDSIITELPDPKQDADVIELFEQAVAITYEWIKPWFVVPLIMDYKTGLADEGQAWGSLKDYEVQR